VRKYNMKYFEECTPWTVRQTQQTWT